MLTLKTVLIILLNSQYESIDILKIEVAGILSSHQQLKSHSTNTYRYAYSYTRTHNSSTLN